MCSSNTLVNLSHTLRFILTYFLFTGRSILLTEKVSGKRVCGTIEYAQPYVTAEAKFLQNIGGKVIFRQVEKKADFLTIMYSDLFKTKDFMRRPIRANTLIWSIVDIGLRSEVLSKTRPSRIIPADTRCSRIGYRHIFAHGTVPVAERKGGAIYTNISSSLSLNKPNPIMGRYLLLREPNGRILSCAAIRKVIRKEAVALFYKHGVKGKTKYHEFYLITTKNFETE